MPSIAHLWDHIGSSLAFNSQSDGNVRTDVEWWNKGGSLKPGNTVDSITSKCQPGDMHRSHSPFRLCHARRVNPSIPSVESLDLRIIRQVHYNTKGRQMPSGLSRSDRTAKLTIRRGTKQGNTYRLSCRIEGWPNQSAFPDGPVDFDSVGDLLKQTDGAFGKKTTLERFARREHGGTRCFDWTSGNGVTSGEYRGQSYEEGKRPTNLSLFITDPLGIAWRVDLPTEEEPGQRFSANRVFDIPPDQWQRVISLCTKDGRATGETALLIKGVTTMTTCQVQHAKIFPEDFHCMERGSCDLSMGGLGTTGFKRVAGLFI